MRERSGGLWRLSLTWSVFLSSAFGQAVTTVFDDAGPNITYTPAAREPYDESWHTESGVIGLNNGTISFSNDSTAEYTFTFTGTSFQIFFPTKNDRGNFSVEVDGQAAGIGSGYSLTESTESTAQFNSSILENTTHSVIVANVAGADDRITTVQQPFIVLDYVSINTSPGNTTVGGTAASASASLASASASQASASASQASESASLASASAASASSVFSQIAASASASQASESASLASAAAASSSSLVNALSSSSVLAQQSSSAAAVASSLAAVSSSLAAVGLSSAADAASSSLLAQSSLLAAQSSSLAAQESSLALQSSSLAAQASQSSVAALSSSSLAAALSESLAAAASSSQAAESSRSLAAAASSSRQSSSTSASSSSSSDSSQSVSSQTRVRTSVVVTTITSNAQVQTVTITYSGTSSSTIGVLGGNNAASSNNSGSGGSNVGLAAGLGAGLGGAAALGLLGFLFWLCRRRRNADRPVSFANSDERHTIDDPFDADNARYASAVSPYGGLAESSQMSQANSYQTFGNNGFGSGGNNAGLGAAAGVGLGAGAIGAAAANRRNTVRSDRTVGTSGSFYPGSTSQGHSGETPETVEEGNEQDAHAGRLPPAYNAANSNSPTNTEYSQTSPTAPQHPYKGRFQQ